MSVVETEEETEEKSLEDIITEYADESQPSSK